MQYYIMNLTKDDNNNNIFIHDNNNNNSLIASHNKNNKTISSIFKSNNTNDSPLLQDDTNIVDDASMFGILLPVRSVKPKTEDSKNQYDEMIIVNDNNCNNSVADEHNFLRTDAVEKFIITKVKDYSDDNDEDVAKSLEKKERTHNNCREMVKFPCSFCGRCYRTPRDHLKHERSHLVVKRYKCSFCQKPFARDGDRKRHERIHTNEKPFACQYCGRRFTQSSQKTNHERTRKCFRKCTPLVRKKKILVLQSQWRSFACQFCGRTFSEANLRCIHESMHGGELKPYLCRICGKSYQTSRNRLVHERSHRDKLPIICQYCSRAFSQIESFCRHLLDTHHVEIPPDVRSNNDVNASKVTSSQSSSCLHGVSSTGSSISSFTTSSSELLFTAANKNFHDDISKTLANIVAANMKENQYGGNLKESTSVVVGNIKENQHSGNFKEFTSVVVGNIKDNQHSGNFKESTNLVVGNIKDKQSTIFSPSTIENLSSNKYTLPMHISHGATKVIFSSQNLYTSSSADFSNSDLITAPTSNKAHVKSSLSFSSNTSAYRSSQLNDTGQKVLPPSKSNYLNSSAYVSTCATDEDVPVFVGKKSKRGVKIDTVAQKLMMKRLANM